MQLFSAIFRPMSPVLGLLLLFGCEPEDKHEYSGKLYFGVGSYLGQLDLRDGSVAVLANLGDTSIRELDAFGDEQLLLTVFGPVNRKDTFRLMQYELGSGGLATLINGRHGRYLPSPEALIFDDGAHLRVRLYGGRAMEELSVVQHRFGARARILQVSDTNFLYSIDPDEAITSFDVDTKASRPLTGLSGQCRLDGALWIARRAALLCKRKGDDPDYAFVSLDGRVQGTLAISDATQFRAVAYLEDQDALVLTEAWNTVVSDSTRYAVWIVDLKSGRMARLARDQYLGSSVVYRPT